MARIELSHITKRWGRYVGVDDLNLVIDSGAFVTLLGPSGCGKTTTLRMIAGLETPTRGRIMIDDVCVFDSEKGVDISASKRSVGFLFQNYALWPNMSVYQNIAFGLSNMRGVSLHHTGNGYEFIDTQNEPRRKLSREDIDKMVQQSAHIVKIVPFLDRYPSELSGGQQQRVAIARTLAPQPKVLFMDEPLSNLDAKLRLEMRTELQRLHLSTGSTFLYVTHDQMEAMTLATKICLMDNGVLQQYDAPLTIYSRPANLFVADFVGSPAMNIMEAATDSASDSSYHILDKVKVKFDSTENIKPALATVNAADNGKHANHDKVNQDVAFAPRIPRVGEAPSVSTPSSDSATTYIGFRPENIIIHREATDGALPAEIFSVMPTGMETTVRVRVGAYLLTAVVFGSELYTIGQTVWISFKVNSALLFKSGALTGLGCLQCQP